MGKYTSYKVKEPAIKRGEVHPVMRGIGCVLLAIVPPLAYGTSVLLVNYGIGHRWLYRLIGWARQRYILCC
jgi:hypothetical protein